MNDFLYISLTEQKLYVVEKQHLRAQFSVSTARNGAGEKKGSEQTPRGWHIIRALIGKNAPEGAVFVGRRWTNEIFSPQLFKENPQRDWILSRILWLCGTEIGKNRLHQVDTMQRYIYIHGAPDFTPFGTPASHGCIRMKNKEVMALFDLVYYKMPVLISESPFSKQKFFT